VELPASAFVHQREVVARVVASDLVLVPVGKGAGDLDAIFTLNEVGGRVWQLLAEPATGERLVAVICSEYEVPAEQARNDVAELLGDLLRAGLIRQHPNG
jgi:hypothetical protein